MTMWERERLAGVEGSWLSVQRWPIPCELPAAELDRSAAVLRADRSVVFCGLLLDGPAMRATGLVTAFDATSPIPPAAVSALAGLLGGTRRVASVERWQRGGRTQ
jgi:hypothetical protein